MSLKIFRVIRMVKVVHRTMIDMHIYAQNALGFQAISRQPLNVWSCFLYQIVQKEMENIVRMKVKIFIHAKCHQKIDDTND